MAIPGQAISYKIGELTAVCSCMRPIDDELRRNVGADLCVRPRLWRFVLCTGADTQVCPYVYRSHASANRCKIQELRGKADKALGSRFDLRAFHDEILRDGALPLDVLEMKVNEWIGKQR